MTRLAVAKLCERRIRDEIARRGHRIVEFGQGLLNAETRRLLREPWPPDLMRWTGDFRVITKAGLNCYVDAKYRTVPNRNTSIEMRSVLAARLQSVTWFYACSAWDGHNFSDFKSISITAMPLDKGCCPDCLKIFHSQADPIAVNGLLPMYCDVARGQGGSGTPYFLVMADSFPYGDLLFDRQPWLDPNDRKLHLPWCNDGHPSCRFTAGSLHCVNVNCGNPHHLSAYRGDRTS